MLNFAIFFVVAQFIGGDAVNGFARDGHYYLNNKGHFTEVSRSVFMYSKWHVYSLFITHPLGIVSALLLFKTPLGQKDAPKVT
jgi:hypothetical protein